MVTTRAGRRVLVGPEFDARIVPTDESDRSPIQRRHPVSALVEDDVLVLPPTTDEPVTAIPLRQVAYVELVHRERSAAVLIGAVVGILVGAVAAVAVSRAECDAANARVLADANGGCLAPWVIYNHPLFWVAGGVLGGYTGNVLESSRQE